MRKVLFLFIIFETCTIDATQSQTIISSKHNLSFGGPGVAVEASSESEICIFCHTPHSSRPSSPLWNKEDMGTTYTIYNTTTLNASPNQPDGSSLLCLSCHDGSTALGNVMSRDADIAFLGGVTTMPTGKTNLSTILSDDHPISFLYSSSVATADQQLKDPSLITPPVELENGKLQCTSCHDPHDNTNGKFLVTTRQNSDLCLSCHDRDYWSGSTHNSSTATWNGSGSDPWFHTDYTNVGDNACENCHNPHNASDPSQPLLNSNIEETNCLVCHSGNVASTDIQTEISKIYSHNVSSYNLIHDVGEAALISTKHVECYDCHNPHATNNSTASAPNVNGFNQGVKGVDLSGNNIEPIQYQYELCFRCHGDSPDKPGAPTLRLFPETNVRLEFNPSNASYHPVVAAGANSNVPSLISPLTESSIIYCTDCHASDDDTAPSGPHGSTNEHILKARYSTQDNRREQSNLYALCYSCHSRNSILGDNSFKEHDKHLDSADAPCNACHDPHGSSGNTHLINFDLNIVSPRNGVLLFEDLGQFKGRCTLRCHGENHNGRSY